MRAIITYHKTGTHAVHAFGRAAAPVFEEHLDAQLLSMVNESSMGHALSEGQALTCRQQLLRSWWWSADPRLLYYQAAECRAPDNHCPEGWAHHPLRSITHRMVQMVRDPFAQVVSSYLYHRTAAEPWLKWPLDRTPAHGMEGMGAFGWQQLFMTGMVAFNANLTRMHRSADVTIKILRLANSDDAQRMDPSKVPLTPYQPRESYSGYLLRVPPREGLFVEALRLGRFDLPLMRYEAAMVDHRPMTLCLDDLSGSRTACQGAWARIIDHLNYPPQLGRALLGVAVNATCRTRDGGPSASQAQLATADQVAADGGQPSVRELRELLIDVDAGELDGALRRHQRLFNCTSGESMVPSLPRTVTYPTARDRSHTHYANGTSSPASLPASPPDPLTGWGRSSVVSRGLCWVLVFVLCHSCIVRCWSCTCSLSFR